MHAQASPTAHPPGLAVGALRQTAFELCAKDRQQQACEVLSAALKLHPGHAELLGDLAAMHLLAGRHAECIEAARGALASNPDHDESAYALAMALAATGQFAQARDLHAALSQGDRAARFASRQPQLAARSREEARRLASLIVPSAAATAPADEARAVRVASAKPVSTQSTPAPAGGMRKFIWEDFDPYTRLPARPSKGGLSGWYSDHPIFEELIVKHRPRRILEVGSLFGASAVHMARLLDKHGVDAEITCVDTFLGSRETFFEHREARKGMLREGRYHFLDEFLGNVQAAGQAHRITPFVQTSTNAARILRELGAQFDLIYLDASHEYIDVMSDLREWWPLVAEGGVLVGDDFEDPWFGIIRAGMEFADEIGRPIQLHKAFASSPAGGRQNTKFVFTR